MNSRPVPRIALGWLMIVSFVGARAGDDAARAAPTRPGATATPAASAPAKVVAPAPAPATAHKTPPAPVLRFPNPEWVDIMVAAKRLGLKVGWKVSGREAVLTDMDTRLEVASDRIEVELDGQRVFLGQALVSRGGDLFITKIDLERCLLPLVRPAIIGRTKPRPKTIVIDPGHGGPDKGKINERLNLFEKTYTLDTSLRLKKILETRGWKVVLTRSDDRQLKPGKQEDLQRRAEIADEVNADVFVSIHFNAVADQVEKVSGLEVYRFSPQHQPPVTRALRRLDDEILNPGNANDPWNSMLAYTIQRRLLLELKLDDRGFKHDRLAVLRLVSCPAVLIEGGFLSNTAEARRIATAAYRQQLAEAIANGLTAYATQLEGLRLSAKPKGR
ncbi:MAG: N-acetylmuramoyl-L-alanine amidase [Undibacterium sp.]|nr:N-acetylmuramoyl-L-alanine amidase [Opitutaceae bacterium]